MLKTNSTLKFQNSYLAKPICPKCPLIGWLNIIIQSQLHMYDPARHIITLKVSFTHFDVHPHVFHPGSITISFNHCNFSPTTSFTYHNFHPQIFYPLHIFFNYIVSPTYIFTHYNCSPNIALTHYIFHQL